MTPVNEKESENETKDSNRASKNASNHKQHPRPFRKKLSSLWKWMKAEKFSDWCIVAFTGVLAGSSIYQFNVMRGQLDQMQNSGRPYIFTDLAFGELPIEKFNTIAITPFMFNAGTSPATGIVLSQPMIDIETDTELDNRLDNCSFKYPDKPQEDVLAPAGSPESRHAIRTVKSRFIPDEERKLIVAGQEEIVITGSIKYSGILGGDFVTNYCSILDPATITDHTHMPWHICHCRNVKNR